MHRKGVHSRIGWNPDGYPYPSNLTPKIEGLSNPLMTINTNLESLLKT